MAPSPIAGFWSRESGPRAVGVRDCRPVVSEDRALQGGGHALARSTEPLA